MKRSTIELSVGIFVALGIASLLMLALRVSGLTDFYSTEQGYNVSAVFSNIGGLKTRSKVTIGGVTVGRVTDIDLEYNETIDIYEPVVQMHIDKDVHKIPVDSQASILTSGLLGDNYVSISLGHDEEYLKAGDKITMTSQALILEDLISKFAVGSKNE